jgi:hypothetical protein
MANLPWLDEVRRRLARHALPPAYIQRFVQELSDHLEDLKEENMSTEANVCSRLGQPECVAEAAVDAYRRRSFLGRHPTAAFLVFGLSPGVSLIVLFILMGVGAWAVGTACAHLGGISKEGCSTQPWPVALAAIRYAASLLTIVIPAAFASYLYCKLAERLFIGRKWMVVSCIAIAAVAMLPCWDIKTRIIRGTGHWAIQAGVWIPGLCGWSLPVTVAQLVQLLAPLAIGWWFLRRNRDQSRMQLAQ